jgi:hypothetical protein
MMKPLFRMFSAGLLMLLLCQSGLSEEQLFCLKKRSDKGIYLTAYTAQSARLTTLIKQARAAGLNTFVIEAKTMLKKHILDLVRMRHLTPRSRVFADPLLSRIVARLHKEGFIVSVRLVVFKDDHLVLARPDLAIRIKGGGLYRDHMGGRWADPYSDEVRLYNAMIAERAALSGVDEVQFDYIRFPAEGKAHLAYFPHYKKGVSRVQIVTRFLKEARRRLKDYDVSIAVDIFGVTAWQRQNDIKNLGQDLKAMAPYIDVLSPMFYPSHFHSGYDDIEDPGAHPFYFVNTGVRKAKEILSGEVVAVVPWLQGFDLRSPNFGPDYILKQIRACRKEGVESYLIWNASNDYWATFSINRMEGQEESEL